LPPEQCYIPIALIPTFEEEMQLPACLAITCLILSSLCVEPEATVSRFEFNERHMGTEFQIVLYARNSEVAARASRAAFDRVARLDAIMSDYNETSELNSACRDGAGKWVKVSRELFHVLEISQDISEKSDGAFDVTIGPLTKLWRRSRRMGQLPDKERLQKARELVGYKKLRLDRKSRSISLEENGMTLDLGGIAKGYAADEAVSVLQQSGIRSALVVAGGEVALGDAPPGASGWKVEIASAGRKRMFVILKNCAISTSGDAEQFFEVDGVRYSHVIDPRTGQPITGQNSVTVVAPRGIISDAWATAIGVLGAEKGIAQIEKVKGAAALIIRVENDKVRAFESKRWSAVEKASVN
jgi:thiamine biosynthesis lipoprotein